MQIQDRCTNNQPMNHRVQIQDRGTNNQYVNHRVQIKNGNIIGVETNPIQLVELLGCGDWLIDFEDGFLGCMVLYSRNTALRVLHWNKKKLPIEY